MLKKLVINLLNHYILIFTVVFVTIAMIWILGEVGTHWPDSLPNWLWKVFGYLWVIIYICIVLKIFKSSFGK